MKKFFAILAIAAAFTACGGGENKEAAADSTATPA
ncbi:MAG TPA: azurin, partial [Chitinophagaceae bacterium]|nr:azurin [Chitinophagaceae bacterium]